MSIGIGMNINTSLYTPKKQPVDQAQPAQPTQPTQTTQETQDSATVRKVCEYKISTNPSDYVTPDDTLQSEVDYYKRVPDIFNTDENGLAHFENPASSNLNFINFLNGEAGLSSGNVYEGLWRVSGFERNEPLATTKEKFEKYIASIGGTVNADGSYSADLKTILKDCYAKCQDYRDTINLKTDDENQYRKYKDLNTNVPHKADYHDDNITYTYRPGLDKGFLRTNDILERMPYEEQGPYSLFGSMIRAANDKTNGDWLALFKI